jgi:hypothetical protein
VTLGLFPRKANLGPLGEAFGLTVDFAGDRIAFGEANLATTDGMEGKLSAKQRIRHLVRTGPLTVAAIADELELKEDTVIKALKRNDKTFVIVPGEGGPSRYGLAERRPA